MLALGDSLGEALALGLKDLLCDGLSLALAEALGEILLL